MQLCVRYSVKNIVVTEPQSRDHVVRSTKVKVFKQSYKRAHKAGYVYVTITPK